MKDLSRYSDWDLVNNFTTYIWETVFCSGRTANMPADSWINWSDDVANYTGEIYKRCKKSQKEKVIETCYEFIRGLWKYGSKRNLVLRWKPEQWQPIDSEIEKFKMSILSVFPKQKDAD